MNEQLESALGMGLDVLRDAFGEAVDTWEADMIAWFQSLTLPWILATIAYPPPFNILRAANKVGDVIDIQRNLIGFITPSLVKAVVTTMTEMVDFSELDSTRVLRADEAVKAGFAWVADTMQEIATGNIPAIVLLTQRLKSWSSTKKLLGMVKNLQLPEAASTYLTGRWEKFLLFSIQQTVLIGAQVGFVLLLASMYQTAHKNLPLAFQERLLSQEAKRKKEKVRIYRRIGGAAP